MQFVEDTNKPFEEMMTMVVTLQAQINQRESRRHSRNYHNRLDQRDSHDHDMDHTDTEEELSKPRVTVEAGQKMIENANGEPTSSKKGSTPPYPTWIDDK